MINFSLLHKAGEYYEKAGFLRVETPWTVTSAISNITKPPGGTDWSIVEKNKVLVASGEQSFLYLYNKGFLPKGQFQTTTPCFRDESFDPLHTKYFIKNELIKTDEVNEKSLLEVIGTAALFFEGIFKGVDIVKTEELSYDIFYRNIELGSYGIRECSFLKWIYGTGCAEPRTSLTAKANKVEL